MNVVGFDRFILFVYVLFGPVLSSATFTVSPPLPLFLSPSLYFCFLLQQLRERRALEAEEEERRIKPLVCLAPQDPGMRCASGWTTQDAPVVQALALLRATGEGDELPPSKRAVDVVRCVALCAGVIVCECVSAALTLFFSRFYVIIVFLYS